MPASWSTLLALVSACLLVAGCTRESPANLVIINGPEPESLDPHLLSGIAEQRIAPALFEGLLRRNPTNALPVPGLASHHEVSTDRRRYTFHLRPGIRWSDGQPLTSADVVFSWRRLVNPASAARYADQMQCIQGAEALLRGTSTRFEELAVRALDPGTVQVDLVRPVGHFLDLCALPALAILPRHFIEQQGDQWIRRPGLPCSGPYLLERWRLNDRIRLRRNPSYWDAGAVRSEVIDLLPSESASATINLFETGGADIVWDRNLFPPELAPDLRPPRYHTYPYLGTYFFRINTTRPPFDDPRVRRAIALAVDRARIVQRITRGGELPATSFTPPGCGGYQPPPAASYQLDEARALLRAAGYPGGRGFRTIEYLLNSGGGGGARLHEQIAIELQAQLKEHLGLRMEIRPVETKIYYSEQSRLNYDLCRSSWLGDYNDPTTFLDVFRPRNGNNRTGWSSARYETLLDEAERAPTPARRLELLRQAETLLTDIEPPIVPLYFYSGFCAFDPERIEGIHTRDNLMDLHPLWAIAKRR